MPQECDRRVVQPNAALRISYAVRAIPKLHRTGFGTFLIAHHIEFDTDFARLIGTSVLTGVSGSTSEVVGKPAANHA